MEMTDIRRHPSLLDGTVRGDDRDGSSHRKDICRDLPHEPSRAMEQGELQDQRHGKVISVPTH
jgi:hypothetical protein